MRRPAFKDITNGVGRVEGEDLLDLTTAELKNQWKLRGIKGHSKLSGDVKGALVKALWPDAPSRPVAPSTTKRKRSENIFRVAHDDELERESHEQLKKRYHFHSQRGGFTTAVAANIISSFYSRSKKVGTLANWAGRRILRVFGLADAILDAHAAVRKEARLAARLARLGRLGSMVAGALQRFGALSPAADDDDDDDETSDDDGADGDDDELDLDE